MKQDAKLQQEIKKHEQHMTNFSLCKRISIKQKKTGK